MDCKHHPPPAPPTSPEVRKIKAGKHVLSREVGIRNGAWNTEYIKTCREETIEYFFSRFAVLIATPYADRVCWAVSSPKESTTTSDSTYLKRLHNDGCGSTM